MEQPLYLRPRVEEPLRSLLADGAFLHRLVDGLGSPLNVLAPRRAVDNAGRFLAVYRRHRLTGRVYFAHKANRSTALLRELAAAGGRIGVDAASAGELSHALGCGFTADRVLATGPKDTAFLWLAARVGATVQADSPGELERLAALVRTHGFARVPVLLRLGDFESGHRAGGGVRVLARRSRFGTPVREAEALLAAAARHRDAVELTGVGYHLDTVGVEEKVHALEECVRVLDACLAHGLSPRAVDVGGGFGVGYVEDAAEWDRYTTALTDAVRGARPPLAWRGHGYGLRNEHGTVRGSAALYPAHRAVAGPAYLDDLLSLAPSFGRPAATLLLEHLHEVYSEPGRALVDQCGLSLARVVEVRASPDDPSEHIVRLAANSGDISLEEHGVLVDPVLVPRGRGGTQNGESRGGGSAGGAPAAGPGGEPAGAAAGVYLAGNLCLEADLLTRRKVFLPRLPRPGDLLAFANTAGYAMDFRAHNAQRQPTARTVAVRRRADGWHWRPDEDYWPVDEEDDGPVRPVDEEDYGPVRPADEDARPAEAAGGERT
ncbi:Y4yA family PLP-dependent enzyme [Actinacidiphila sp. DG2A-62]|uniref:Y4yA family PLP-dependent enzyme n=1 Tax=Actinacidiphila sp. DG2A-62 TaxID=3108821 RepID=UPI002DBB808A|nr:Y4yA family PLP-dependent enzyme [Actinacidiphila sp. DG2A-62]MEC3993199.1 Y4yA family PLP-dependent enzyme [Actinacidiphila sp. DG2A-62]